MRLVFLPNPNNPTGTYFTAQEFDAFMQVAASKDVFVVLDEAYVEFVRAKITRKVMSTKSASKIFCFCAP